MKYLQIVGSDSAAYKTIEAVDKLPLRVVLDSFKVYENDSED